MAQHEMVTFRLHRTAIIFIVIGAILAALFIFAGGYLLGHRKPWSGGLQPAGVAQRPEGRRSTEPVAATQPSENLAVRVGVFGSEEEAKAFVQQLAARKLSASIVPVTTSAEVTLYTVQVGQYATRAAAAAAAKSLHDEHGLETAVVPAGMGALKE